MSVVVRNVCIGWKKIMRLLWCGSGRTRSLSTLKVGVLWIAIGSVVTGATALCRFHISKSGIRYGENAWYLDGESSREIGWIEQADGSRFEYVVRFRDSEQYEHFRELYQDARTAGRGSIYTWYFAYEVGFPVAAIAYLDNSGVEYSMNLTSGAFVPFPRYRLEKIIWIGLLADMIIWSLVSWLIAAAWRYGLASQRRAHGRCGSCGYDVRGSLDRCPECGSSIRLVRRE
jgi:hypothetical protein